MRENARGLFRFRTAAAINEGLSAFEFAFGWILASSALVADSLHVAIHAAILIIASIAMSKESRAADTLGAKLIALLIIGLATAASLEALPKIFHPVEIDAKKMLGVSFLGLLVNIGVAWYLWNERHAGESAKAYWACLMGDLASSGAAIIAAIVIIKGGEVFRVADPAAALLIAGWLFWRSYEILKGKNHHHLH